MKKLFFSLICFSLIMNAKAQDIQNLIKPIIAEGEQIYKLEMANWIGNEVFADKYKGKEKPEGNISYIESDVTKAVFYTKGDKPKVLATITFDKNFDQQTAVIDLKERELNRSELTLSKLRALAQKEITDAAFFTKVPNTTFSVIPMINNNGMSVFVLSEPDQNGTVIFGNDYLLQYDVEMMLTDKQALHKIPAAVTYDPQAGAANDKTSSHTHIAAKGDLITSTDIATLLLYKRLTSWTHHTFISENYIYFWNYASAQLQAIPKGAKKNDD